MRERYLSLSPYNLVRVILPDSYSEAARLYDEWSRSGILVQDPEPSLYAYFQEFKSRHTGERLTRKGFIGLGEVVDYSAGIVHRHEQTLTGPKQDRLALLRATRAHAGQLFMLYPDPEGAVDAILDEAAQAEPLVDVTDEYSAVHRMWRIPDAGRVQRLMADKKLLIADGHHRYETAQAFLRENPNLAGADRVMMTMVNMHSKGVEILPTHRIVSNVANFEPTQFFARMKLPWSISSSTSERRDIIRIGVVTTGGIQFLERPRRDGELDVAVLHREFLGDALGISEEAVRDEKHIRYARTVEAVIEAVRDGAQIAFLLNPTPVEDVARVAFSGGVMPQKSTDFYPKMLSGLAIYRLTNGL
jgi:uncharacterized protein (DUF1015 family)